MIGASPVIGGGGGELDPLASSVRASWGERHANLHLRSSPGPSGAKLGGVTTANRVMGGFGRPDRRTRDPVAATARHSEADTEPIAHQSADSRSEALAELGHRVYAAIDSVADETVEFTV
jgi:hypothetical protein